MPGLNSLPDFGGLHLLVRGICPGKNVITVLEGKNKAYSHQAARPLDKPLLKAGKDPDFSSF